jgi:hypothetical protein
MTPAIMKIILAVLLMAHGLGHGLGILAGLGNKLSASHSLQSRFFTNLLGESLSKYFGMILSIAAILVFLMTGFSLLGWVIPTGMWQAFGVTGALISLFLLAFYRNFLPFLFPNKVGALVINLWLLLSILWWHWPTALFL